MTEEVPCLLRVGDNVKKHRLFKLDRDQVTIGRSGEVTYAILSNMISRCHAIIKRQEDKTWAITDNKSLNGIFVNGRQLTPFTPYVLQDGDMVQLGVPTTPDTPAEYVYKFYSSLRVRIEKKSNKRLKPNSTNNEERDTMSAGESLELDDDRERKRKKACERLEDSSKKPDSPNKALRQSMEESQRQQAARELEYQARLAQMEQLLKEKEEKQKEVQEQLERERQEKENQAREVEELRLKEQAILMEMQDKQEKLEKEKEELKQKMQAELEANLKERETVLLTQLTTQREALLTEKQQIEKSLQAEMEKALEEKNKELEQQLLDQKQKLEKVLEKKDMEQKLLESQLNATKEESETAKHQALKAREDILSNFVDLMEMELQCTICNELFIKATSLNCAHVFCKLCISQWMKVKKECPNCRTPISSQMQAIALDSYIDKMVEQLNDEMKLRRAELVEQRKAEQNKFDGVVAGPSAAGSSGSGAGPSGTAPAPAAPVVTAAATTAPRRGARNRRATRRAAAASATTRGAAATATRGVAATTTTNAGATTSGTTTVTAGSTAAATPAAATTTTTTAAASTTTATTAVPVIELSDDSDESNNSEEDSEDDYYGYGRRRRGRYGLSTDEEDDDDDDSVEGDPGAYYGGYGRCYNCGMRGHWANGCPN